MAGPIKVRLHGVNNSGDPEKISSTDNALDSHLATSIAGEDLDRDVTRVEFNNKPFSVTRTTTDASVGTVGAVGDFLHRVIVTGVIGAADLTISDGEGTVVCVVPGGTAAGAFNQELNVEAKGGGFVVDLHATNVGTVTCFGDFS